MTPPNRQPVASLVVRITEEKSSSRVCPSTAVCALAWANSTGGDAQDFSAASVPAIGGSLSTAGNTKSLSFQQDGTLRASWAIA